jgi:hypothetical protein
VRLSLGHGRRVATLLPLLAGLLLAPWTRAARSQGTTILAPDASNARAREVIQRSIQALGGPAYLGVRDYTRDARYAAFDHNGSPRGTVSIVTYSKYPDKERIEYIFKTYFDTYIPIPIIPMAIHKTKTAFEVHNGDGGWTAGGGGVEDLTPEAISLYQEARKKNINILLRLRLNDPDLILRYTGIDTLDLKQVEWVEISDADHYTTRIAFDHTTHLPVRATYLYRDPVTHDPYEDADLFSNYRAYQGIMTPMQTLRMRNGVNLTQLFIEDIKYNTGLSDSLFTRESLEQVAKKNK